MAHSPLLQAFDRYLVELRRFFSNRVACREATADLTQETWLRLAQVKQPELIGNPRAFLFHVAQNLALDHLRRRQRFLQGYAGPPSQDLPSRDPLPDTELDMKSQYDVLRQAIVELPPRCRTAFLLHRVEGLSYAEIARRLSISPKTVEKHVSKALVHCRDRLGLADGKPVESSVARPGLER